jgi:hypothetical protein
MTGNHPGTENIKERHFQDWILSVWEMSAVL